MAKKKSKWADKKTPRRKKPKKKETVIQKLRRQLGELQARAHIADNFYQDMRDLVIDEKLTSGYVGLIDTHITGDGYEIHQGDESVCVQSRAAARCIIEELTGLLEEDKSGKAPKVFQKP